MIKKRAFGLVLTVFCASICPLSAQNFTPTGSMNEARVVHTATLLNNGTVLVTGGPSNTAEIYNPQTGTWRYTLHPMNYARTGHTAVTLGDGRVLIAGGTASPVGAEIFDPGTEQFTLTNPMNANHGLSPGIVFNDGRVLIVTGSLWYFGVGVSEIYSPLTNAWTVTPNIPVGVSQMAGVGLPDGTALAIAGYDGYTRTAYPYVERYDPATNTVTDMASMIVSRLNHTATLMPNGKVLIVAGSDPNYTVSSTEIYDPTVLPNGQSQLGTNLNQGRRAHSATLLPNGDVLVIGGGQSAHGCCFAGSLSSAELRDHDTGTWNLVGSMSTARQDHRATLLPSGAVLVTGGGVGQSNTPQNTAEIWGNGVGVGTISVTTNVNQGAFDIEPGHFVGSGKNFTQPNVPAGSYTISYSSVAGCTTTPPGETKQLSAGGTINFSGTYQGCTGTIEIDSNIANAKVTLSRTNGIPVRGGGPYPIILPNMAFDTYTVTFDAINGYNTPAIPPKEINVGALTTFTGNYTVNGTAGLGRIIISTNLDAASFGVTSISSTSFTPFTRSGKFFDTLNTVPAGTYRISFTPVSGYYTPPDQTLTLAPSGTIQFSGIYRRLIVALFTGFSNRPISGPGGAFDGVTYPDTCSVGDCPGMAALAQELRADTTLNAGIVARTFTFYDIDQYKVFKDGETSTPGCGFEFDPFGLPIRLVTLSNPECIPPLGDGDHSVGQTWVASLNPTPDDRIVVIGHSYGGNRARLFAKQLLNLGYTVDGLVTVDPVDWNSCSVFHSSSVFGLGCDFSLSPYIVPDALHYLLSFTQTQSQLLKGYHLAKLTADYPYTVLNDPSCIPNLVSTDYFCSHVNIASRFSQGGGATGDVVHNTTIQFVKSVQQDSGQPISQVQVSNITTGSAVVSWRTQDDTQGGQVIFSLQQNFGTSLFAQESGPPGKSHSVTLPGLQSDTTYYFKVQTTPPGASAPITSGVEWFHTTPTVPKVGATSWSLSTNGSTATLTFILTNSGARATGVSISAAKVGATSTTTQLPLTLPDLTSIQPAVVTLTFPASIGSVGATVAISGSVKYSGGTVPLAARVQIQ